MSERAEEPTDSRWRLDLQILRRYYESYQKVAAALKTHAGYSVSGVHLQEVASGRANASDKLKNAIRARADGTDSRDCKATAHHHRKK